MKITYESGSKKVVIEDEVGIEHIDIIIEDFIKPLLIAAGFSAEVVEESIPDCDECEKCNNCEFKEENE